MPLILKIAVPCPLRQTFDYLPDQSNTVWQVGQRVRIPFGSRELIGIIIAIEKTDQTNNKLKPIIECLDEIKLLPIELLSLTGK